MAALDDILRDSLRADGTDSATDSTSEPGRILGTNYVVHPLLASRVNAMIANAPEELQPELRSAISSGYRTQEQQAKAYANYQNGGGLAAPPGHSWHEQMGGLALDWNHASPTVQKYLQSVVKSGNSGLVFPIGSSDPWHMQLAESVGYHAPDAPLLLRQLTQAGSGNPSLTLGAPHGTSAVPDISDLLMKQIKGLTPAPLPGESVSSNSNPSSFSMSAGPGFTPGAQWSALHEVPNALIEGAGLPIEAATAAAKESLTGGLPFSKAYAQARSAIGEARDRYKAESPGQALTIDTIGSLPLEMGGLGLGRAALTRAAPEIVSAFNNGGMLTRGAGRLIGGAAEGAESAVMNQGLSDQPLPATAMGSAAAGAVTNPLLGSVIGKFTRAGILPEVADAAGKAERLGIPLTASELSPNLRQMGWMAGGIGDEQLPKFTQAVSRLIGADTPALTRAAFNDALTGMDKKFQAVSAKGSISPMDAQLISDLSAPYKDALTQATMLPAQRKMVQDMQGHIEDTMLMNGGGIPGPDYMRLTQQGSSLANMVRYKGDNQDLIRQYGSQFREALDNALERGTSDPTVIEGLRDARRQWRTALALEPIVEKAQPSGVLNPREVSAAFSRKYGRYAYGDLADTADVGRLLPRVDPNGTGGAVERSHLPMLAHIALGTGAGAAATGGAYESSQGEHELGALGLGLGAMMGGPPAIRYLLQHPAYVDYLLQRSRTGFPSMIANPLVPLESNIIGQDGSGGLVSRQGGEGVRQ